MRLKERKRLRERNLTSGKLLKIVHSTLSSFCLRNLNHPCDAELCCPTHSNPRNIFSFTSLRDITFPKSRNPNSQLNSINCCR
ncbi:hypothetical protein RJT34_02521 [Clitoria ternatea]|uniref:Uncharacterized protein n=1 Tax=Clitoria ternatea TaxID=43366 RepID=A0AAN9KK37_CLITE